jgi:hypothetical protein
MKVIQTFARTYHEILEHSRQREYLRGSKLGFISKIKKKNDIRLKLEGNGSTFSKFWKRISSSELHSLPHYRALERQNTNTERYQNLSPHTSFLGKLLEDGALPK